MNVIAADEGGELGLAPVRGELARLRARRWMSLTLLPLLASVAFFVAAGAWALSSPVGSAPDDTYHLPLIWCAWGESDSCKSGDAPGIDERGNPRPEGGFLVPESISHLCTYQKANLSASCTYAFSDDLMGAPHLQNLRQQQNLAGTRPYHQVLRLFVGPDAERSAIVMRLFNVAIAALLLFMALVASGPGLRRAVSLAWMVCVVPLAFFIIPSTNPSSWAVSGIGTFWAFLYLVLTVRETRSLRYGVALAGLALSAGVAVAARADSVIYLAASGLAVGVLCWPTLKRFTARRGILVAAVALGALAVVLLSGVRYRVLGLLGLASSEGPVNPATLPSPENVANGLNPTINHLLEFPSFLTALVGNQGGTFTWPNAFTRGLGWLDSESPSIVGVFALSCLAAVCFWGLSRCSKSRLAAIAVLGLTLILMAIGPLQAVNYAPTFTAQPRYLLPLLFPLVGVLSLITPHRAARISRLQAGVLATLLATANAIALLAFLRRNTNGQGVPYMRLDLAPSWWWEGNLVSPNTLWVSGVLAGCVYFAVLASMTVRRGRLSF